MLSIPVASGGLGIATRRSKEQWVSRVADVPLFERRFSSCVSCVLWNLHTATVLQCNLNRNCALNDRLIHHKTTENAAFLTRAWTTYKFRFAAWRRKEIFHPLVFAPNNSWNRRTIHLAQTRLLTNCHKSVNCFKGKSRLVQVAGLLSACTTRLSEVLSVSHFIRNAFSFNNPVGKILWQLLAEIFKELYYPGKKTSLFLNGSVVLFFGNERDFRQMLEFWVCRRQ